jgi:vacuolar protein sorting-associated protein 3
VELTIRALLQHTQFVNDLIAYYLDTVISVLQSSPAARAVLSQSNSAYRALRSPKPSYLNFIIENAPPEPWWQSRLRLLQLLAGGPSTQYTSFPTISSLSYSIPAILDRIEPFQNEMVSESIILDGLQGRHREALHLLTHGLGDYDSAIRYCLYRGPTSSRIADESSSNDDSTVSEQSELFRHLLSEFLRIADQSDRIERTNDLLTRFAPWFDVGEVLRLVPDDWSIEILSGFLVRVFRGLVLQAREARINRALSASLNLQVNVQHLEAVEKIGGWIENEEGLRALKGEVKLSVGQRGHGHDGGESEFGEMVAPAPAFGVEA